MNDKNNKLEELQQKLDLLNEKEHTPTNKMSKKDKHQISSAYSLVTQIGIHMIVTIFLCFFIGQWLDNLIGTAPIFLFIFTLIGVLSAFVGVYKISLKEINRTAKNSDYLNIDINAIKNEYKDNTKSN